MEYCVGRWVSRCPGSHLQVMVIGVVRFVWQLRFCGTSGGSKGKKRKRKKWLFFYMELLGKLICTNYVKEPSMLLTSSSDRHACDYLRSRGLDVASEDCSGFIEARYNSLGNPAALVGLRTAEKAVVKVPLYTKSSSNGERAILSDDTSSRHGGSQRHHWARCVDLCTGLYAVLWKWQKRRKIWRLWRCHLF